jgi:hypothetical protein
MKIYRKYKLLSKFYYYYFYPLGSHVSTKLVLIKCVVLPAYSSLWFSRRPSGSASLARTHGAIHSPHSAGTLRGGWGPLGTSGLV